MDQLEITIYAKARCPCCWRAMRLLRRKAYAFEAVYVTDNDGPRTWFEHFLGREAPYVFVDDRPVGGAKILRALDRSGDLDRLVRGEV